MFQLFACQKTLCTECTQIPTNIVFDESPFFAEKIFFLVFQFSKSPNSFPEFFLPSRLYFSYASGILSYNLLIFEAFFHNSKTLLKKDVCTVSQQAESSKFCDFLNSGTFLLTSTIYLWIKTKTTQKHKYIKNKASLSNINFLPS